MLNNHIKRSLFRELKKHLEEEEITIIVGPRQAGKTTLMKELLEYVRSQGAKTLFINLDYEKDKTYLETQDSLLDKLRLEFGREKGYVFIDEIQRKKNAGLFLKGIYDLGAPYKFIVSGSGSLELKENIHESLAGRKRLFELTTVNFFEFADFKTDYAYSDRLFEFFSVEKERTKALLEEYLNYGGYPRVILSETIISKTQVINEIFSSVIERDIAGFLNAGRPEAFSAMIKILSSQTGRLLKYSELAKQAGVSLPIIKKYLWYAEKTFIIRLIRPFFSNKQKEILKSPAPYFYDLGMRNFCLGLFGNPAVLANEGGFVFQNLVANILYDNLIPPQALRFWRTNTGAEVDFVIDGGRGVVPVEAKFTDLKKMEITRSLRNFMDKYRPRSAYVVNRSFAITSRAENSSIQVLPFWKIVDIPKNILKIIF